MITEQEIHEATRHHRTTEYPIIRRTKDGPEIKTGKVAGIKMQILEWSCLACDAHGIKMRPAPLKTKPAAA